MYCRPSYGIVDLHGTCNNAIRNVQSCFGEETGFEDAKGTEEGRVVAFPKGRCSQFFSNPSTQGKAQAEVGPPIQQTSNHLGGPV